MSDVNPLQCWTSMANELREGSASENPMYIEIWLLSHAER